MKESLARALSDEGIKENHNCFCLEFADSITDRFMFMRLGCGCVIHYHCLIQYIKFKIGDRLTMSLRGMSCPYGSECKSFETLEDESKYFITTDDIENIYQYGLEHPQLTISLEENEVTPLLFEEVEGFKKWIEERKQVTTLEISDDDHDLYTISTTKGCPSCGYRSTHYHGHQCHHVSPEGGCPNCKVHYCYKCLSTETENIEIRGERNMCKCGYWSNFCFNLKSIDDIEQYLDTNEGGIPFDVRCGCVICCDCKYREPCSFCSGDCTVCRGFLNPSPKEILVDGSEWIREGPRFNDGEDDEEYDNDDEYGNYGYDEYGNVIEEVEEEEDMFHGYDEYENVVNLWEYCRHGLYDDLLNLINIGLGDEELNMLDRNGRSALYLCCDGGHEDCVRILLQQSGIDCNIYDENPSNVGPPLLAATLNRFENIVALLLEHPDIAVNSAGRNFDRACDRACISGNERIVSMLLNHPDTDPWRTSLNNSTCLHAACQYGSLGIVRQLLNHRTCTLEKVNIRTTGFQAMDALGVAYEREHDDIVLTLLEFPGIDTSTFLVNVCERSRRPTIPATILALIDVNRPMDSNSTPLIHACICNKVQVVEKLLSLENINVNCVSSNGEDETPLILATNRGLVSISQLLLNHPETDPNYVSKSGVFPLLFCLRSRSTYASTVLELLLNHPRIESSVHLAMEKACQKGFTDVVRLLIEYPITNVNRVDEDGISYLHNACFFGHTEIVELLLEHDAIDVFIKTNKANTPLKFAVNKGRKEIVDMLIRHPQFDPCTMFIPSR